MKRSEKERNAQVHTILRRMREAAKMTMREVGAMIGVSHVTISQFENGKLELPRYRIEQLVTAYGLTMKDFEKITGRPAVFNLREDCHAMIDRMNDEQLAAIRELFKLIHHIPETKVAQSVTQNELNIA